MIEAPPFLGVENSISGRRWRARLQDERLALTLSQRLGLPEILGRVLAARQVGLEDAPIFLRPTLRELLPDPLHLRDMNKALRRLVQAIENNEKIAVFGDYDVDGATSSALLKRYFAALGIGLRVYIPDRQKEGYGPNPLAMQILAAEGMQLVITVDCGTMSFAALDKAADLGMDVIVTDHHKSDASLPRAVAVVNPNRLDETSPHRQLAAVGVTFLLLVGLNRALREAEWFQRRGLSQPDLLQWLDLVALGTVCDIVPLTGVNRALVNQGLKVIAQRRNPGIAALADIARLEEKPAAWHLGFLIGPRVNAGGRVGQSDLGMRILTTDNMAEAVELAALLDSYNRERQAIEAEVLEEATAHAMRLDGRKMILVAHEGWHPGVIGIVAARLREKFNRPAFVLALKEGIGKGSGRSVPGVDLGALVLGARQAGLIKDGGGHAMAAGLTVEAPRLAELIDFFEERLNQLPPFQSSALSLGVDGVLSPRGANRSLLDMLEQVGPFGAGHSEPRFVLPEVRLAFAEPVGENHVRCSLEGADGARLKAVAFRALSNPLGEALLTARSQGRPIHVAGQLRADNWRGQNQVQFQIEDAAWAIS